MNVDLLKSSWAEAQGYGDGFVLWFYARLFAVSPELQDLFGVDMEGQREKIGATLDLVVAGADNIEAVVPRLRKLGKMHRRFGVTVEMFDPVGEALLATFARFLGDHWTDETRETWTQAFKLVSGVMTDAYQEADRNGEPATWRAVITGTRVSVDRSTLTVEFDTDLSFPWQAGALVPVRLGDQPGTWRLFPLVDGREFVVVVTNQPDGITLDLLSAQPGDRLLLAAPIEPVDQEVTQ